MATGTGSIRKLFCSDLDGTMFPFRGMCDPECLSKLKCMLKANPDVALCYVTGRSLLLALDAIEEHNLPEPDYLITDVGTSIYSKSKRGAWIQDARWRRQLGSVWHENTSQDILDAAVAINGVEIQPRTGQSEFKIGLYVSPKRKTLALRELHRALERLSVPYTLVLSHGADSRVLLDVLPRGASKKRAVKELMGRLGVKAHDAVFAGDSGNDFDLLVSRINNVVVNNASPSLKFRVLRKAAKRATLPTLYLASGRYGCHNGDFVCGVLEGALYFGVFSKTQGAGLRIQIHSVHGLINKSYTDLGRDEDTGGQVVYVVELAKALSRLPEVAQVDLMTRRIDDDMYPAYRKRFEYINRKLKIVRIDCGPKGYIKKTRLWPYLDQYVDNVMEYIKGEGGMPDVIHANYADAGYACTKLSEKTDAVFVFTGHSLGIPKMQKLGVNGKNFAQYDRVFNFSKRLAAEQAAIKKADAVIGSTRDELDNQYSSYRIDTGKFHVIPPGVDTAQFHPPTKPLSQHPHILDAMTRGLDDKRKPIILAASRLERRKNIPKLVEAFCGSRKLRDAANLVVLTRMRSRPGNEQKEIYDRMKKIVRDAGCHGSVAFVGFIDPKIGLGTLYRNAARSRGVFVNPALIEPFGLTLLEASACGLPVVATMYGGPSDIITDGVDGILVDPKSKTQIERALVDVITNRRLWNRLSSNGIKNAARFSWDDAARKEVALFHELLENRSEQGLSFLFGKEARLLR